MSTKVTKNFFEYGNMKYFRGNAHLVSIGTYGEKKDPIGARAYLEPEDDVSREHLESRVKYGTRVKVDWNAVTQADFSTGAKLKFFGLGKKVAMDLELENARSAKLELINLSIADGPLKSLLNNDAGAARNYLADEGKDSRIVSEVWVVMDAQLAQHFATHAGGNLAVKAVNGSIDVSVSGGSSGTQTVSISKNTAFAYKCHKVTKWNKGKTLVEEMDPDYKGMD